MLLWIIVAVASAIIEIVTLGDLICIWFSIGALAALLLAWLKVKLIVQIIVFFIVSIAVMLIVRPLAIRYLRGNTVATNSDRYIGKTATLLREITDGSWGLLNVGGSSWSCTSVDGQPIEKGTKVKIMAIDGAKLIVRKADQEV